MNLAWTFGDFMSPKHCPADLAGYPAWVRRSPNSSGSFATAPGSEGGDAIAHVGGVAVEETLLPLVSGLATGRRKRAQWCWTTTTWL